MIFASIYGNNYNLYFHVLQHELKRETNDVSKASNYAFRSKGPDDENFCVSLPVKFHGDEEFQKFENQGILK